MPMKIVATVPKMMEFSTLSNLIFVSDDSEIDFTPIVDY